MAVFLKKDDMNLSDFMTRSGQACEIYRFDILYRVSSQNA
jgi:hypothetical protein